MAKDGERQMLFDIRGRRKRVIQVVYAALALLMALSLLTVVGPVSLGDLTGGGSSSTDASGIYDDQVERLERKLRKNPNDEAALVQLTRAHFSAASTQIETDPATGQQTGITEEGLENFEAAGDAWERYLKTDPEKPNAIAARFAAQALLNSSTLADLDTKVKDAANAQAVFAEAQPSASSYLELAKLRFLSGDVAGAEKAGQMAKQEAEASQRAQIQQILKQYQTQSVQLRNQAEKATKFQPGAGGEESLQNPLGGLSGGGTGTGAPAP